MVKDTCQREWLKCLFIINLNQPPYRGKMEEQNAYLLFSDTVTVVHSFGLRPVSWPWCGTTRRVGRWWNRPRPRPRCSARVPPRCRPRPRHSASSKSNGTTKTTVASLEGKGDGSDENIRGLNTFYTFTIFFCNSKKIWFGWQVSILKIPSFYRHSAVMCHLCHKVMKC